MKNINLFDSFGELVSVVFNEQNHSDILTIKHVFQGPRRAPSSEGVEACVKIRNLDNCPEAAQVILDAMNDYAAEKITLPVYIKGVKVGVAATALLVVVGGITYAIKTNKEKKEATDNA